MAFSGRYVFANPGTVPEPPQPFVTSLGKPLEGGQRGIILSPPVRATSFGGRSKVEYKGSINPDLLRSALLYFDHIDVPINRLFDVPLIGDAEWLQQAGLLSRTEVDCAGLASLAHIPDMFAVALQALEEASPGRWCTGSDELSLLTRSNLVADRGFVFRILNALPVPKETVPFEDILRFKEDRAAELEALRFHLEKTYLGIASSPDRPLAEAAFMGELDTVIAETLKAGSESEVSFNLSDFRVSVGDIAAGLTSSAAVLSATQSQVEAMWSGVLALGLSATCSVSLGAKFRRQGQPGPFEYVVRAQSEL